MTVDRLEGVHVVDVVVIDVNGNETLYKRKIYSKLGPAKSFRTRWINHVKAGWWWPTKYQSIHVNLYTITPNGYVDVP